MKVVLLAHTPTPEQTVAAAARLCYSDTDVEACLLYTSDAADE